MKSRVYLRAFNATDYKKSFKWRNDIKITDGLISKRIFVSEENERKWIENANEDKSNNIKLAICLEENDIYIGNVYLTNIDQFNRKSGIGIFIGDEQYQNKGHAREAIKLILEHAFYDLALERVEARQFISNIASVKLHEKCGFIQEGVLRNYFYKNGRYNDVVIMSILRADYCRKENKST